MRRDVERQALLLYLRSFHSISEFDASLSVRNTIRVITDTAARYLPDGRYALVRLALTTLVATLCNVGMWAVIVVLPQIQAEYGVSRSIASMPYTITMFGFAFGAMVLGRLADQRGIVLPILIGATSLGAGYILAGIAPNFWVVTALHFLVGIGAGTGFGPLMADISHWFVKRRGLAVVIVASGNYIAGSLWPLFMNQLLPTQGWRGTYIVIGIIVIATAVPMAFLFRRRPTAQVMAAADAATAAARADLGISPKALQSLLVVAGFACCVAMSMPQVHIVAYCGDLGYGVARGAEMLSLMLGLGVLSRLASGYFADRIGGAATLLIGSIMQGTALTLYLFFNGLTSLYVISAIFGLFQGGIVPMYAVICREFLPPREAGQRIGLVISATIFGMAFGGMISGVIFDMTGSYRLAFFNGVLWNGLNLAVIGWLVWKRHRALPEIKTA